MSTKNARVITESEAILEKFFGESRAGVVAVVEVSCTPEGKPRQARDNAQYLDFILTRHCGMNHVDVYRGIDYWRQPRDEEMLEAEMSEFSTDFAVYHKRMPKGTIDSLDPARVGQLTIDARKVNVIGADDFLTDELAYSLICDEESARNGDYSRLRGKLAHSASRAIIQRALKGSTPGAAIESRVMEFSTDPKMICIDGEWLTLERNGQIDLLVTFPETADYHKFMARMGKYKHLSVTPPTKSAPS